MIYKFIRFYFLNKTIVIDATLLTKCFYYILYIVLTDCWLLVHFVGDSEVQRTMLELLNQLDGFEPKQNIKVWFSDAI